MTSMLGIPLSSFAGRTLATIGVAFLLTAGCTRSVSPEAGATPPPDVATTAPLAVADPDPTMATAAPRATTAATTNTTATTTATTTTTTTTTTSTTTSTTTTNTTTTTTTTVPVGPVVCPPTGPSIWEVRPPSDIPPPVPGADWTTASLGSSVQGRTITALVRVVDEPRRRVVVIGGLHGNEPVSPPAVRALVEAEIAADIEVWLVPEANPDGVAAGMRCNANGVDLNRNFPWGWRADDGGPGPLSEPETAALAGLIERLRPDLVVWVHQPYGYVSSIGPTDAAFEEAWALAAGVPVRPDVTQHGGGESWTALTAGVPSMLIEIDTWAHTEPIAAAHRAGFEALLDALG